MYVLQVSEDVCVDCGVIHTDQSARCADCDFIAWCCVMMDMEVIAVRGIIDEPVRYEEA